MIYNYPKIFFFAPKYSKSNIFLLVSNTQKECCNVPTDDSQNVGRG